MKFIITENRREQIVDKFLTTKYGGLISLKDKNNDLTFFLKDTGRESKQEDVVFYYNRVTYSAFIPWEMVTDLEVFGYGLLASRRIVKYWLKKTYNIEAIELFRKI